MNNPNSFPPQKANKKQANPKPYHSPGVLTFAQTSHKFRRKASLTTFCQADAVLCFLAFPGEKNFNPPHIKEPWDQVSTEGIEK